MGSLGFWRRAQQNPAGRPSGKLLKRRLRDPYWAAQGRAI